jgi:hypothetical protein
VSYGVIKIIINHQINQMKSLLALGIVMLLPLLAIFTLIYFGIHGFKIRFALQKKAFPNPLSIGNFSRETVSAQ